MKIDLDINAQDVGVSTSGYRNSVSVEVRGVDLEDLVGAIESAALFSAIELEDYIDWADNNSKLPEILDRLSPDEVITWLRDNGHLESADD